MSVPSFQIRRATVDDLGHLAPLWREENLPVADLERRFKEFQVAEASGGEILGAMGLQISGQEGRLHSEVFAHAEQSDALRKAFWERAQVLATNHGLLRLWTQLSTPFWRTTGFSVPHPETLVKLPASFGGGGQPWLVVQLREEAASAISLDKEFAMFREAEKERTERLFRQARVLKMIAMVVATGVLLLVVLWAISFFRLQKRLPR